MNLLFHKQIINFWLMCMLSNFPGFSQAKIKDPNPPNTIEIQTYQALKKDEQSKLNEALALTAVLNKIDSRFGKRERYWKAYLDFHIAISLWEKKREKAQNPLKQGIALLESIQQPDSEDLALLCLMKSMYLSFVNPLTLPFAARKVKLIAEEAIALNPSNPRAHLAMGSYDAHTPTIFGGGKIAEIELQKTLLFVQKQVKTTEYEPTWGHYDAYYMLINFMLEKENWNQVIKYGSMASKAFPENPFPKKAIDKALSELNKKTQTR